MTASRLSVTLIVAPVAWEANAPTPKLTVKVVAVAAVMV
jgi:hypothetical protein